MLHFPAQRKQAALQNTVRVSMLSTQHAATCLINDVPRSTQPMSRDRGHRCVIRASTENRGRNMLYTRVRLCSYNGYAGQGDARTRNGLHRQLRTFPRRRREAARARVATRSPTDRYHPRVKQLPFKMRATYASRHRRQITPHEYTLDRGNAVRETVIRNPASQNPIS